MAMYTASSNVALIMGATKLKLVSAEKAGLVGFAPNDAKGLLASIIKAVGKGLTVDPWAVWDTRTQHVRGEKRSALTVASLKEAAGAYLDPEIKVILKRNKSGVNYPEFRIIVGAPLGAMTRGEAKAPVEFR